MRPRIALLPWGDVIEDYLDAVGISLERFRTEMTGGWLFGYVEALKTAGIDTVLYCVSRGVRVPLLTTHVPTGAALRILPATRTFLALRRLGRRHEIAAELAPYFATPLGRLARALRTDGCVAVLCQEYHYPRFDACVALGALLKLPVFASFQGGNWQMSRIERQVRPHTIRRGAGFIVGSSDELLRLSQEHHVDPARVVRIFNPMDVRGWVADGGEREATRRSLGIGVGERVAVWHGRVDMWRKGLDVLIEAWQLVGRMTHPTSVRLLLVGSGGDADQLRQVLAGQSAAPVTWVDEFVLDRNAIRRYLSAGDVFVFPSRYEGFPVAPVEAMATGLPVVAAAAAGVTDIFDGGEESGALVVPTGDPVALASALVRVLGDEQLGRTLGQRGRASAEARFDLASVGAQLGRVLLGHGNGRRQL